MNAGPTAPARTIGIYGAGKSGIAIARRSSASGHEVRIATSGPADRTDLITAILSPAPSRSMLPSCPEPRTS
ncbi:NAD(P)-binding domain-containing protein [Amycolatopsis sp. NPDC005232]|uniref:NAD(P)-binding domain-containing protein n=1 Tax=Amycolatopsis sp. NPDC005232 TaxID=3157027 RepID=UPI00339EADF4